MRSQETNANTVTLTHPRDRVAELSETRKQMSELHKPQDAIVNTVKGAGHALKESVDSGSQIMTNTLVGLRNKVKQGAKDNGLMSKLGLGALAAVFSLKGVSSVSDLFKSIFSQKEAGHRGPGIILSGGQALFGGAMALGLFRAFTGAPGMMNFGTITTGIVGFTVLSMIKSNYQNPNSLGARIFKIFGIGDNLNSVVDSVGLNERANNEVLR
jgi:hypothetical protein